MALEHVNILHKLYNRTLTGRATGRFGCKEKELRLCEPRQPWYYVPLKSIVDQHETLLRGHVLLGFLKDGIHLLSYLCIVESSETNILHSLYTYSLFIWKFDLGTPLSKVCSYSLFEGELINSDLQLVICESPESDRIVILGAGIQTEESSSRQCYVTVVPSPDIVQAAQNHPLADVYFIHFKYDIQPPFPPFSPLLSLKLRDTIICNTGDTMTTYTVETHENRCDFGTSGTPSSVLSSTPGSVNSNAETDSNGSQRKRTRYLCSCPALRSADHLASCVVGRMETVHVATEYDILSTFYTGPKRKRSSSRRCTSSQSPKIHGDKKNGEVSSVTTYSYRMYGLSHLEPSAHRIRYDATHALYPTRVSSLAHGPLRTTYTEVMDEEIGFKPSLQDDFVTVKQVSFDAELYLTAAVHEYVELGTRYVSLKDYDMRLIDVCTESKSLVILIMVLCYASHKTNKHRQVLVSSGFLLSWDIVSGCAYTLDQLPVEEFADNPCSNRTWYGGGTKAMELRKQWFVPTPFQRTVRAFSNCTVFTGKSLTKLQHPYLPVAIIL